jgi:BolA protein
LRTPPKERAIRTRQLTGNSRKEPEIVSVATEIEAKLRAALKPLHLEIVDESARHAGHAGVRGHAREGGETHFRVMVVSQAFEGQSRVARQRMVYDALSHELANGVHAVAMTTLTPAEADRRQE